MLPFFSIQTTEDYTMKALLMSSALLIAAALVPGSALAQQSDVDAVKAANATYLAAIGSLDIKKMEPLWAHESYVTLIGPGDKSISVGWDAVKKNWEDGPFKNSAELKVTAVDGPYIHVNGNVAWATGINHADGKMKNGNSFNGDTFNTQVYEKQGGRWLLVSNTALFVPK
jgi:ketosteroid isomerase-like protein